MGTQAPSRHSAESSRANVSDANGAAWTLYSAGNFCRRLVYYMLLFILFIKSFVCLSEREQRWDGWIPRGIDCGTNFPRYRLPRSGRLCRFSRSNVLRSCHLTRKLHWNRRTVRAGTLFPRSHSDVAELTSSRGVCAYVEGRWRMERGCVCDACESADLSSRLWASPLFIHSGASSVPLFLLCLGFSVSIT